MPKVSQSHVEKRREQIVQAAIRCIRSRGIAETRMRHIFQESGLSAGAVYNHFPSKLELIEHLAAESEKKWLEVFAGFQDRDDRAPREMLRELLAGMIDGLGQPAVVADIGCDVGIWAYAINKPSMQPICQRLFKTVAAGFDKLLTGNPGTATTECEDPTCSGGTHLLALLQGLGLQAALGMPLDLEFEKRRISAVIDALTEESNSC